MDQRELEKAEMTKRQLDKISGSFCTVKWKHATLNLSAGAVKSCCHLPFRPIELKNLKNDLALHDTNKDREERAMMLQGKKPDSCRYCWWLEEQGHFSDRIIWSSKSWMAPYTDEIAHAHSSKAQAPSWLELNFSNVCNLKCSYCSPIFSSKWQQEILQHGPYPTHPRHNDLRYLSGVELGDKYDNTELMNQFWPWFENTYPELQLLKVTGGEPFLSPNTYRILDWIVDHPNPALNFSINSNLSVPEKNWNDFIERISEVRKRGTVSRFYLHPSIDTFGARAEYIRHGLDFRLFQQHVEDYLERAGGDLVFICTLNNLSLGGLLQFWKYLLELKQRFGPKKQWVSVTSEILMGPDWQNLNILPESFQSLLQETIAFVEDNGGESLTQFSALELHGLNRALDMMRKPTGNAQTAKANFHRFFSEHDRRRGTDLLEIFPELTEFWRDCLECRDNFSASILPG